MNDNDYEMQVEDLIKAEEIKYEVVLVFPYFSHDSTALCYTEGATQQNTQYRLPAEQWWVVVTFNKKCIIFCEISLTPLVDNCSYYFPDHAPTICNPLPVQAGAGAGA